MQLPQNQKATSSFSHRILEFQIPGWNMILAKFQQISTQRTPHKITVTLTAFKRQLFTFDRPTYRNIAGEHYPDKDPIVDEEYPWYPIYRPEPLHVFQRLPEIRPSVLYIFGESSKLSPVQERENKMARTGTGVGGCHSWEGERSRFRLWPSRSHGEGWRVYSCNYSFLRH